MNSKRRLNEDEETHKAKNYITANNKEQQAYSTSNEWPVYSHPEGGLVKITPWGSLRQYTNPETGELVTKFEDSSFQQQSFHMAKKPSFDNYNDMVVDNPGEMPPTPQSIQQCKLSTPLRINPGDEVESYVLHGYDGFSQEQENYFGMAGDETE